jgi:hypothetical protein
MVVSAETELGGVFPLPIPVPVPVATAAGGAA